mmetsp:Transcript_42648/g.96005  ORF Transcript_42648/g.96005 Transcript_42648/m.96005 type:complete len:299 (-) Transcript_42648:599-1495(-)
MLRARTIPGLSPPLKFGTLAWRRTAGWGVPSMTGARAGWGSWVLGGDRESMASRVRSSAREALSNLSRKPSNSCRSRSRASSAVFLDSSRYVRLCSRSRRRSSRPVRLARMNAMCSPRRPDAWPSSMPLTLLNVLLVYSVHVSTRSMGPRTMAESSLHLALSSLSNSAPQTSRHCSGTMADKYRSLVHRLSEVYLPRFTSSAAQVPSTSPPSTSSDNETVLTITGEPPAGLPTNARSSSSPRCCISGRNSLLRPKGVRCQVANTPCTSSAVNPGPSFALHRVLIMSDTFVSVSVHLIN